MREFSKHSMKFIAVAALFVAAACLKLPTEGVGADKLGSLEATVVDQFGNTVSGPVVRVVQRSGNDIVQQRAGEANNNGIIRFEVIQEATVKVWADPPEGYTGGAETNATEATAKSVAVTRGLLSEVTIRLTKL
jgi:hypothetical protein